MLLRTVRGWLGTPKARRVDKPLLFLHIPKTAGCSVNKFLVNRFDVNHFQTYYPGQRIEPATMIPIKPRHGCASHVWYDITNYLPPELTVFTVLREPIDRALSAFFFFKRVPPEGSLRNSPDLPDVQHMQLGDFIRRFPNLALSAFGNYQTYYMSRRYTSDVNELGRLCTREDLGKAKDNLAKCVVGVMDRLRDSLALLCHEYGWPCPDRAEEINRTSGRPQRLDAEAQSWLEENTALDAELVRFGRELFEQRWGEYTRHHAAPPQDSAPREYRLTFDQPIPGHGWHPREPHRLGHFCFQEQDAWLECRRPKGDRVKVEIHALSMLPPEHESPVTLRVNGNEVALNRRDTPTGPRFEGVLADDDSEKLRLEFHAERPVRLCDLFPGNEDTRPLSLAVREVRLRAA